MWLLQRVYRIKPRNTSLNFGTLRTNNTGVYKYSPYDSSIVVLLSSHFPHVFYQALFGSASAQPAGLVHAGLLSAILIVSYSSALSV